MRSINYGVCQVEIIRRMAKGDDVSYVRTTIKRVNLVDFNERCI